MAVSTSKSDATSSDLVSMNIVDAADNECVKLFHFGELQAEKAVLMYMCENMSLPRDAASIVQFGIQRGLKFISYVKTQELIALLLLSAINYAELEGISLLKSKYKPEKLTYGKCNDTLKEYISFLKKYGTCPRSVNLFSNQKAAVTFCNIHLFCVQSALKVSVSKPSDITDEKKSDEKYDNRVSEAFESFLNGLIPTLNGVIKNVIKYAKMDPYGESSFVKCSENGEISGLRTASYVYYIQSGSVYGLSELGIIPNGFTNTKMENGGADGKLSGTTHMQLKAGPIKIGVGGSVDMFIGGLPFVYQFNGMVGLSNIFIRSDGCPIDGSMKSNPFYASVQDLVLNGIKINPNNVGNIDIKLRGLSSVPFSVVKDIKQAIKQLVINVIGIKMNLAIKNVINDSLQQVLPVRIGASKNEGKKQVGLNIHSFKSFSGNHFRQSVSPMMLRPSTDYSATPANPTPLQQAFQSMMDSILYSFTSSPDLIILACSPAIVFDPSITKQFSNTTSSNYQNSLLKLNETFNFTPSLGNGYWNPSQNQVSNQWNSQILGNAMSHTKLLPNQKQELENAQRKLYTPGYETIQNGKPVYVPRAETSEYTTYSTDEKAYQTAVTNANSEREDLDEKDPSGKLWAEVEQYYETQISEAKTNWENDGVYASINKALETVQKLQTQGTLTAIENATNTYNNNLITITDASTSDNKTFAPYLLNPNNVFSDEFNSWTSLKIDSTDINWSYQHQADEYGGSATFDDGIFYVGADGNGGSSKRIFSYNTKNVQIEAEYARIQLNLPWYEPGFMSADNWYLEGEPVGKISTGKISQNISQQQQLYLPAVPSELVVLKSFRVSASWGSEASSLFTQYLNGSTSFSIGPFQIHGGYYNESSSSQSSWASFNNGVLEMNMNPKAPQQPPQVCAVICQIPPYAPKQTAQSQSQ